MVSPVSIFHEWAEEKMGPLWAVCMCFVPTKFQGFRNFRFLLLHQPLWDVTSLIWMIPATDYALCGRWQCGDISTQFFACSNGPRVHPFQPNAVCNTESAIFFFPLKFTDRLKWSNAECCHQSDIVSDFKNSHMCLTGSISLHCSLSAGKRTRLPRGLGACANQALFPSPLCKSLGMRQHRSTLVHLF